MSDHTFDDPGFAAGLDPRLDPRPEPPSGSFLDEPPAIAGAQPGAEEAAEVEQDDARGGDPTVTAFIQAVTTGQPTFSIFRPIAVGPGTTAPDKHITVGCGEYSVATFNPYLPPEEVVALVINWVLRVAREALPQLREHERAQTDAQDESLAKANRLTERLLRELDAVEATFTPSAGQMTAEMNSEERGDLRALISRAQSLLYRTASTEPAAPAEPAEPATTPAPKDS